MAEDKEERVRFATNEIIGKGNLDVVSDVFSTSYLAHLGEREGNGPQFVRWLVGQLRTAFPDLEIVEIKPLIQDADTIAWQRTLSGTHEAELMGIPPRGRKVEWRDMLVTRFDGEKIAEDWVVSDLAGWLLSLPPRP